MKFQIILISSIILLYNSSAQEYANKEFHFNITLPAKQGWAEPQISTSETGAVKKPLMLLYLSTHKSGKKVSLQVIDVDDDLSMSNIKFREGFKHGMLEQFPQSFHVVNEKVSTLDGIPSYELTVFGLIQNSPLNMRIITLIANGLQYNLIGYCSDTTKLIEPDLDKILSTFRLTNPQTSPTLRK